MSDDNEYLRAVTAKWREGDTALVGAYNAAQTELDARAEIIESQASTIAELSATILQLEADLAAAQPLEAPSE